MRLEHAISDHEAHVWSVALQPPTAAGRGVAAPAEQGAPGAGAAVLSAGERARLERLAPALRHDFVVTRWLLRTVLARYVGVPAAELVLEADAHGKPHVRPACGVLFSLSHTAGSAVVGVARVDVGVDIERERPVPRMARMARRVLHDDTVAQLKRLSGAERRRVFFDAWTQREAHVKAVGGGLFLTPDTVPFSGAQAADGGVRVVADRSNGAPWSVARFELWPGVRGTLVARGALQRVLYFEWGGETDAG